MGVFFGMIMIGLAVVLSCSGLLWGVWILGKSGLCSVRENQAFLGGCKFLGAYVLLYSTMAFWVLPIMATIMTAVLIIRGM